ncbi:prepilin-type N-terminal cleavage/methylation domain-containing protein [Jeotgalibacillus salarius]|uniref:Prepilin-type N-terminal cleavage/methylation domain-containing protein n=1 Tax=Jeotgalibacillus salarius TaxID=546023 RepID=A0A4Y8LIW0_9BACL|nr:prepilin-type N-terminal cleavage/methylation domain-containing protein [Jeotgalibacillus salarius]TFE01012.1 prepilin-type N-terminal cleavage/methylation domain-containing protein [Jeotgalibacillus salarius]
MSFYIFQNKKGFTLIEVLASITLLNIIIFSFLTFFLNSYNYTFANQDQTVGSNVARNTVTYIESQDFLLFQSYLNAGGGDRTLTAGDCTASVNGTNLFEEPNACLAVFQPVINNQSYTSEVSLTFYIADTTQQTEALKDEMIQVESTVVWERKRNDEVTVRGVLRRE